MDKTQNLLEVRGIKKSFANNVVLKGIDFDIKPGEIHVFLGENGAGKSTLIKILTGAYQKDDGDIFWEGKPVQINSPIDAIKLGIATIYQELNVVPELTVYENIFLGREIKKNALLDIKTMKQKSREFMEHLGQDPDIITKKISELGIGKQQLVEIAKALTENAKLLIMDEPTASLSGNEVEQLFKTIFKLKKQGIAIIFISHRLEEIKKIGDRITILRDGMKVDTLSVKTTSTDKMIELMVGRPLDEKYPKKAFEKGRVGFEVKNLRLKNSPHRVSFSARQGEILGISGLVGAGRTELMRGIFGANPVSEGEVVIFGEKVKINNPKDAIDAGIAFISEDRKGEGLFLDQTVFMNVASANLKKFKKGLLLSINEIRNTANRFVEDLKIKPNDINLPARKLSGGNQQKVVISKWLNTNAKVFIFDEPTRGIDVGAKVEVYRLINSLVDRGSIVIIVSSELPEILGMCDRVLVMHEGKITADLPREEASQEVIMKYATGGQ
jgi:ribose transport system ATP-binding protein